MKTAAIFDHDPPEDGLLHSMVYPEADWHGETVIDWLYDFWTDAEKLRDFFLEHEGLLSAPFWQDRGISRNVAIRQVMNEADDFFFQLEDLHHEYVQTGKAAALHDLFKELHKAERGRSPFRYKAKPEPVDKRFHPMLRLYGIKLDSGQMLITGGGIKLTREMQGMPLLLGELERIDDVKAYIQQKSISCVADFLETD